MGWRRMAVQGEAGRERKDEGRQGMDERGRAGMEGKGRKRTGKAKQARNKTGRYH